MKDLIKFRYSPDFRSRVVSRYRLGIHSIAEICEPLKISPNLLQKWNRWYYRHHLLKFWKSQPLVLMEDPKKRLLQLEKELRELKEAYEDEKLKRQTYELMIRVAEREFEIPIRKKYGAKLSRKLGGTTR